MVNNNHNAVSINQGHTDFVPVLPTATHTRRGKRFSYPCTDAVHVLLSGMSSQGSRDIEDGRAKRKYRGSCPLPKPLPPGWSRGEELGSVQGEELTLEDKLWLGRLRNVHNVAVSSIIAKAGLSAAAVYKYARLAADHDALPATEQAATGRAIGHKRAWIWTKEAIGEVAEAIAEGSLKGTTRAEVDKTIQLVYNRSRAGVVVQSDARKPGKGRVLEPKELSKESLRQIRAQARRHQVMDGTRIAQDQEEAEGADAN